MAAFRSDTMNLAGVPVQGGNRDSVRASIREALARGQRIRLAFCNAHTLALAMRSRPLAEALGTMTVLNDGVGLDLATLLLHGRRFPSNLNGTDFVPDLLEALPPSRIYLLGSRPEVVATAARRLAETHPNHRVVGFRHGFFRRDDVDGLMAEIASLETDILLVGMGNPIQELFVAENESRIDAGLVVCCGALFDFMSGHARRAPRLVRGLRLEWLHRLACEPRRLLRRYTIEGALLFWQLLSLSVRPARGPRGGRPDERLPLPFSGDPALSQADP